MKLPEKLEKIEKIVIENVSPSLDDGLYRIKRVVGDYLEVSADIFRDGHDVLLAFLKYRERGNRRWRSVAMTHIENDKWSGKFLMERNIVYEYSIEAYTELFLSWQEELRKKQTVEDDLSSELLAGLALIENSLANAKSSSKKLLKDYRNAIKQKLEEEDQPSAIELSLSAGLKDLMLKFPDKSVSSEMKKPLEVHVDRYRAVYASWYELFPRSAGQIEGQGATFADVEKLLPRIKDMGFDVLYFPPIHPIGLTNRKGKNNATTCKPGEPGSPYAIGSKFGGHKAIEPELGTLADFDHLTKACASLDMEIALDFAINCSPDHPYVKDHPDWFYQRPDGSIKYAENPPKKYEDIYPLNFYCDDWKNLWKEMRDVFLFWAEHNVRIFRVDNPHTKPVVFWKWLIDEVQSAYPDVLFLAEAFTRPKMMKALAKAGFTQSYTYFTWRNYKHEIVEYFSELTSYPMKDFFRGNLFVNTPDILPVILQQGGRPAFIMRLVLAATLSSVYGIYSGFELCESEAVEDKEEYLNSEKYEYKVWDWNRKGNINDIVTRINKIRRENSALQYYDKLKFYHADNDNILFYGKTSPDNTNRILVVVNLDPFTTHECTVYVPIDEYGIAHNETYLVHDLLNDNKYMWEGSANYISLNPEHSPAHIFKISKWDRNEEKLLTFE